MKYLILGKLRFGATNVIVTLYQTIVRRSFTKTVECLVERDYTQFGWKMGYNVVLLQLFEEPQSTMENYAVHPNFPYTHML